MPDSGTIPFKKADTNGHYRSLQLPNDAAEFMPALGLPAFAGDVVGPGGATVNQVAVFEDATGKKIRAATQTGLAKLAGGVLSSVTAPVGEVVGTTDPQVLTNKTLTNPTITGLTGLTKNDVGLGNVDNTSDATKPVSGPQQAALDLKEDKNKKAAANGYASLDASVKIPLAQIPDSVLGGQQYQGTWNAATNTPTIPVAALGNKGWYYSVNVAGTTNINGISSWAVGDQIISNGSVWQKIANVSAVNSVNGYTGVVVLGKADVGLGNVDNTSDSAKPVSTATATQLALKEDKANKNVANGYAGLDATGKVPAANVPADLVTSVAGKQGVVTLVKGDVGLGNVDNTSDATYSASTATLTNKTINGANNTLTIRLASDVTGNLPVTNLNAGTGANSGSFWRGDGQWAPPAGGGDVIGPAAAVDGEMAAFSGTTGKILKRPTQSAGFAKHVLNGAFTTQAQIGSSDIANGAVTNVHVAPTTISGQTEKPAPLSPDDRFLILDTITGQLRQFKASNFAKLPRGHLAGGVLSNNGADAANDIDIAAGECRDDTNAVDITIPAITKRVDATWVAGNNQGGWDTGAVGNNIHVYVIMKVDQTTDVVMTGTYGAPTMPSGYVYKRRLGSLYRVAGGNRGFTQMGDYFQVSAPVISHAGASLAALGTFLAALSGATGAVPGGLKLLVDVQLSMTHSAGISGASCFDPDTTAPGLSQLFTAVATAAHYSRLNIWCNSSSQIRITAGSVAGTYTFNICPMGYWDYRGRGD